MYAKHNVPLRRCDGSHLGIRRQVCIGNEKVLSIKVFLAPLSRNLHATKPLIPVNKDHNAPALGSAKPYKVSAVF